MTQFKEPGWDSADASALREFLQSPTGQRMIANLVYSRPGFFPSTAHPHRSFANSREIHGYEQAVQTLLSLVEATVKPLADPARGASSYPDLDDEAQWQSETPA